MASPPSVTSRSRWQFPRGVVGNAPYLPTSKVLPDEPLARHTTLGFGGPADLYVEVGSPEDLKRVLIFAAEREKPLFLLGAGSNVAFSDEGFRGIVVHLGAAFNWVRIEGSRMWTGAGTPLQRAMRDAYLAGLGGLETLSGVPGTVGGGVMTNAGTGNGSIADVTREIRCFDRIGVERRMNGAEAGFRYRTSGLAGLVIVSVLLELRPEAAREIGRRATELDAHRKSSQPRNGMSAGCVFRNPPGVAAGKLLDELGFKGKRVGGAVVSDVHANFILNDGSATRRDFDHLMASMRERVRERYGYELEPEVLRVGPYGPE